ncbi:hypothetical protein [Aerosticca soli]|jgi:hypothetical protein|uniref:Uncharacterized protein n=1 Tax=Aerosticca soli TaxID=2010829 RepID=A0A2Z6E973_9GAMM|nr:hypothetical protein [Aerosticca soli]MDI3262806.1 hypothetical protein [Fulvimonas sp.]BBD81259.1 hypothetical protein ALSL_2635 [Aerosticca soli]
MRNRYFITIDDLRHARGPIPALSFDGVGPGELAAAVEEALRTPALFERWRALQPDPDAVDEALGATDPQAEVKAQVVDLHIEMEVTTQLPMQVLRHRLNLLIGTRWRLHDLRPA